jgi:hypothetical protein
MVTERKALERNTLAEQIGRAYQGIKQGPSRSTVIFVIVLAVGVAAFFVIRYFYYANKEVSSERWLKLDEAVFPEQVENLVEDPKLQGTAQHDLARCKEARFKLSRGLRDLGSLGMRKEARKQIEEATAIYEDLRSSTRLPPLLRQEALWGAAKGYESLGGVKNIQKARALYEELQKEFENTALGKDARKQLDRLDPNNVTTQKDLADLDRAFGASARD